MKRKKYKCTYDTNYLFEYFRLQTENKSYKFANHNKIVNEHESAIEENNIKL